MNVPVTITPREKEFDTLLEIYPPKLSNKFLPNWYKEQKYKTLANSWPYEQDNKDTLKTTKNCPAIREYVTQGITIPAWSDLIIIKKDNIVQWNMTIQNSLVLDNKPQYKIGEHNLQQTEPMELNNIENYGTLKLTSPYYFKTPKGYGLHFYDPYYNHRNNIRLLPGKVETDIWHEVNLPFEFINNINEKSEQRIYVKAGQPLFVVVPYKKTINTKLNLEKHNTEFIDMQSSNQLINNTVSNDWYEYKKIKNEK